MRVAVVGGVGYVGSNVVPELVKSGHEVVVLARRSSIARRPRLADYLKSSGAEVVARDAVDVGALLDVEADVYVNMAGAIDRPPRDLWEAHVKLTEYVVEAASHYGSRVVYVSAVAAVGRIPGLPRGGVVLDGDPAGSRGVPESVYEETKARGEDVVATAQRLRGKWCITRPGLVVGRNPSHVEWRLLSTAMKLRVAPSLGWDAPVTHALDLARILEACVNGSLDGAAVHSVSYHIDLGDLGVMACRAKGVTCRKISLSLLVRLAGPLAPGSSRLKMTYLLQRRAYRYESRFLGRMGIPATTPEDAAALLASELA